MYGIERIPTTTTIVKSDGVSGTHKTAQHYLGESAKKTSSDTEDAGDASIERILHSLLTNIKNSNPGERSSGKWISENENKINHPR